MFGPLQTAEGVSLKCLGSIFINCCNFKMLTWEVHSEALSEDQLSFPVLCGKRKGVWLQENVSFSLCEEKDEVFRRHYFTASPNTSG